MNKHLRPATCALTALAALTLFAPAARAQREHLTPAEIEQVRDHQSLDARMGVFVKAVERRLAALSGQQPPAKQSSKKGDEEAEKSDTLTGTRVQLLNDVADILDEAITNIEDATIHSERSPLIPKAIRALAAPAPNFLTRLKAIGDAAKDDAEVSAVERAAESLEQVIDAAAKLPAEETKEQAKAREKEEKKKRQEREKQQQPER